MTLADKCLLLLLLIGIGALFRWHWTTPREAHSVAISSPQGREVLSLTQPQRVAVEGALGISHIAIEDGAVRFVASPCRHKVCTRSGWHRRSSAVAACVPNRISLVLIGAQGDLDAISY